MKTMMKLGVVLAAVLLVATMLVTGCTPEPSVNTPPDGQGLVRMGLGLDKARATFLPGTTLSDFKQFDFSLVPDNTYSNPGSTTVTFFWTDKTTDSFFWGLGDYTLTVIAYKTANATPAYGNATGPAATAVIDFTVVPGTNTVDITLKAYKPGETPGSGDGTYTWNITNVDLENVTVATMDITEIGEISPESSQDLLAGGGNWSNATGVDLPAGFYYVDFTITAGTPATTRYLRHTLHIYQNHTTLVRYSFDKATLGIIDTSVVVTIIKFDPPAEIQPEVQVAVGVATPTPVDEGDAITVTLGTATTVLSLANAGDYISTSIEWRFNNNTIDTPTCTVDTATAGSVFIVPAGRYPISVTGRTPVVTGDPYSGAWYSTEIFIIFVVAP
jgi:hypothetical protein